MESPTSLVPRERIISAVVPGAPGHGPTGVRLQTFVSAECGATAFSTGMATFKPGAVLPLHRHTVSEAITIVRGIAVLQVESRIYRLGPLDCAHIPAGTPHSVLNDDPEREMIAHNAFASALATRELVNRTYRTENRGFSNPGASDPETILRFETGSVYELSEGAFFTDLFARRFGAVGICGGYGRFLPGASLPCHIHNYDESITIVKGWAHCLVQGRRYKVSGCTTAYIPEGLPHRFLNTSNQEMAMIWVYAGAEPDRRVLDEGYCSGTLTWPGPYLVANNKSREKPQNP